MDELKDFLNALAASPKARDLLKEMKEPADLEEASIQYAGLAEELGYHIGKDDIRKWLEEKEKEQREKSAKAETDVKDRLEEDDLDAVAGGADYEKHNTACYTTYDKGEWCWVSDSCYVVITYYPDGVGAPRTPVSIDDPDIQPEEDIVVDGQFDSSNCEDLYY